jgi:hypothetical protein
LGTGLGAQIVSSIVDSGPGADLVAPDVEVEDEERENSVDRRRIRPPFESSFGFGFIGFLARGP